MAYTNGICGSILCAADITSIGSLTALKLEAQLGAQFAEEGIEEGTETIYRVYGGEAEPLGQSWSPINPNTIDNYRQAAGLPDVNTGRFVIEGTVNRSDIFLERSALPLNGNSGGLLEYKILQTDKINIIRVSGVNPQY